MSSDVPVRRATDDDLDRLVELALELHVYEEQFGTIPRRPHREPLVRDALTRQLEVSPGWSWVAEQDQRIVGLCTVQPPAEATWIATNVAAAPVAYLEEFVIELAARGAGVGAALAAVVHRQLDEAGVEVTALDYGAVNPLSGPFWSRQGYRPLLTSWQRCPAVR